MHAVVQPIFETLVVFAWCVLAGVVPDVEKNATRQVALRQHGDGDSAAETNELKTLTAEQARALVSKTSSTRFGLRWSSDLSLNGLSELSPSVAEELAKHEGHLSLNGLVTITDATAEALAKHKGRLSLNGLTTLSERAARALTKTQPTQSPTGLLIAGLELNGVQKLSAEAANALSQYGHPVSLNGVKKGLGEAAAGLMSEASRLEPGQRKAAEVELANDAAEPALEVLENSIGMKLAKIPSGEFDMGHEGLYEQKPVHRVQITKPFYIGIHEVTNAQWKTVMGDTPENWSDADRPVGSVSWSDAVSFCKKLSERAEEKAAGRTYRLPTEAEWEYACRAGSKTRFSFGDDDGRLGDYAWYADNARETHAVGQKNPNAWGLYDMHGNVWEWCGDWHGAYSPNAVTDPTGPPEGEKRVSRGGAFGFADFSCSSVFRQPLPPGIQTQVQGVRVVLVVETVPK
jgi:formylglycine-generating enzyme required for sulfatase activity